MRPNEEKDFEQAAKLIDSRRLYLKQPKMVGTLAARVISRSGVAAEGSNQSVIDAWRKSVDDHWSRVTQVGMIRRGKLEITVSNSLALQQMTFEKQRILERLRQELTTQNIKDIVFKVGPIQAEKQ